MAALLRRQLSRPLSRPLRVGLVASRRLLSTRAHVSIQFSVGTGG